MAGITFLSENLYDTAQVTLTTGTENAQFPLSNLKNDSPSIKFRSIGSTAVLLIDLGMTRDIDYIALAADPKESFLITSASVKTSTTTDFTSSTNYTIDLSIEQAIGFKSITEVSHRYIELTLVGSGGFTEMGKIFIGKSINIESNSISIDSFNYQIIDKSVITENKYGQKFIDVINQRKNISGSILYCTKDEHETLDDMLTRHGQSFPLWMIIDPNSEAMNEGNYKLTIYGYNEDDVKWSAVGGQHYNTSLDIRQAI